MKKGNAPGMATRGHETQKLHNKIDFKLNKVCGVVENAHNREPVRFIKCLNCGKYITDFCVNNCCSEKCADEYHQYLLEESEK